MKIQKYAIKILMLLAFTIISNGVTAQSELKVFQDWKNTNGSQNFFKKNVVKTDASGNIFIAGATLNSSNNYDIIVAKYNSYGVLQWTQQYNGAGNSNDMALGLYIDGSGNVLITGFITTATNIDMVTVKYNSSGTQQWMSTFNGIGNGYDSGADITGDASGNVYVTGMIYNSYNTDVETIKYNSSGTQQWAKRYNYASNMNDGGVKLVVNAMGVAVSIIAQIDTLSYRYGVIIYNPTSGNLVTSTINGSSSTGIDQVSDMVQDASGNIYIAGAVPVAGQGYNYDIIKLNSNLGLSWERTYSGNDGLNDIATGLEVDGSGNVFVTGTSETNAEGKNIVTLKYNSSGTLQWSRTYNDTLNKDDEASAMAMDATGNIYITGSCATEADSTNYLTIKYDASGNLLWTIFSDGDAHLDDMANNIALDSVGDIIVTGESRTSSGSFEYMTIKYVEKQIITPTDYNAEIPASSFSYYCNMGQLINTSDSLIPEIKYYTNGSSPAFYFKDNSSSFVFAHVDANDSTSDTLHRIDMSFEKINSTAKTYPMEETRDYLNYFLPQCPDGITKLHGNKQLVTTGLYSNIDLMYSSNQNGIKMYFIVKPGGSPADLQLLFSGASSFYLDTASNALTINSSIGNITFDRPTAYQLTSSNTIVQITGWQCAWQTNGADSTYKFYTGAYDNTKALVIQVDEGNNIMQLTSNGNLDWSTYYGGNLDDEFLDVETDASSNIYITGYTRSSTFPVFNALETGFLGITDAVILKFNQSGERKFATYYGGSGSDAGNSILADNSTGDIFVVGNTNSNYITPANPQPSGAYVDTYGGSNDGFILKLNSLGTTRIWNTYYGGSGVENFYSITKASGNIYIVGNGNTNTNPFWSHGTYNNTTNGNGLILKFTTQGVPIWATLYETGNGEIKCVKTDDYNNVYIVGNVTQSGMQSANNTYVGLRDAFLARFDYSDNLMWSTYLGGTGNDNANALAIYHNGTKSQGGGLYVTGGTYSSNFPTIPANNSNLQGQENTFITEYTLGGSMLWSSYHGNCGTAWDEGKDIVIYDFNEIIVCGYTYGLTPLNLPGAYYQSSLANSPNASDAFLLGYNFIDNTKSWATYFGGSRSECGNSIAIDPLKRLYMVGTAYSILDAYPLPLVDLGGNAYWQPNNGGNGYSDGFVSRFFLSGVPYEIKEENNTSLINVYPNPANGSVIVSVDLNKSENVLISIYDVMGRKMMENNENNISGALIKQIDISDYSNGIYIINVNVSGKQHYKKLIKQ